MFLIAGFLSVFLLLGLGATILPRLSDASFSSCSQKVRRLQSPGSPLQEKYIIFKPCKTLILLFYIIHCLYRFTYIFFILFIYRCFEFSLLWVYFDKCFHFCHKMTILPLFLKILLPNLVWLLFFSITEMPLYFLLASIVAVKISCKFSCWLFGFLEYIKRCLS